MSDARITCFTRAELSAVITVGIVGVLIAGLQPQLLGALAREGRVSVATLGQVATAELLAMGVAAASSGILLSARHLRAVAASALVALGLLDFATAQVAGGGILIVRAAAGLAEGVLVWLAIGTIVRTAHPARWSGIYLMTQTGVQFALAALLGAWMIPAGGSNAGFITLGAITLAALVVVPLLPRAYVALVPATGSSTAIAPRGWLALAGVAAWLAFVVAVWVYVEPLGLQRGLSEGQVAIVAPLSLAMQMVGAGTATLLAGRIAALPVLVGCVLANAALLLAMGMPVSAGLFVAATAGFGFLWLFAMPFQLPILLAADPSRRAAELVGGAQLAGASAGPFLAARLVSDTDVGGVLWFGAITLMLATVLLCAAVAGNRPLTVR